MARPTKTRHFAIWEDRDRNKAEDEQQQQDRVYIPAKTHSFADEEPRPKTLLRSDGAYCQRGGQEHGQFSRVGLLEGGLEEEVEEEDREDGDEEEDNIDSTVLHHHIDDAEDGRREWASTSSSISSLPESNFEMDYEPGPMHTPYTPPMIRPSFRRPESVRRMQMSSPVPSERGLRRSILSPPRVRMPRSARSSVKSSPRLQKWVEEEREADRKKYPLVLLHLTILPVDLRWSNQSMKDILPASTLEALQLLKSKVSETIIRRGILIPHPKDEYELLEERLLEALELKKERITKCGHFRARDSTSSAFSADSGIGSSVRDLDDDSSCETCHHHLKAVDAAISADGRKWSIKVFAANGLMRASAWTAAWSEMERVDVEILPWIDDDLRKQLDVRALAEAAAEHERQEYEAHRMTEAEEQFRAAQERRAKARIQLRHIQIPEENMRSPSRQQSLHETANPSTSKADDLPRIYQPKDIPLSLLLRNYFYLLAQDKRNILTLGVVFLALVVSLRVLSMPTSDLSALPPTCEIMQMDPPVPEQASFASLAKSIQATSSTSIPAATTQKEETEVTPTATALAYINSPDTNPMLPSSVEVAAPILSGLDSSVVEHDDVEVHVEHGEPEFKVKHGDTKQEIKHDELEPPAKHDELNPQLEHAESEAETKPDSPIYPERSVVARSQSPNMASVAHVFGSAVNLESYSEI